MLAGILVLLPAEIGAEAVTQLAAWKPESGPLGARLPHRIGETRTLADWDALRLALRRQRRDACRRAFLASPFQIAPAVAYLLWKEEEMRAVTAFAECGDEGPHAGSRACALQPVTKITPAVTGPI